MNLEKIALKMKEFGREEDVQRIKELYLDLAGKREGEVAVERASFPDSPERLGSLALAIRQIYLHRSKKLFEGAFDAFLKDNEYVMSLAIRGHLETTGAIGYLHRRLSSLKEGNISLETLADNLATLIMGTGDKDLPTHGYEAIAEAKNVMMMLECADKSLSKKMGGAVKEHKFLKDSYEHLCEFSHPNFHSNKMAYEINKEKELIIIRHDKAMTRDAHYIIGYLLLSAPAFQEFFEDIDNILPA